MHKRSRAEMSSDKESMQTLVRRRWGKELKQWRVNTFCLLCSHSFLHSEKLIGEISKAITTFNWTNSSGPVTAASRGALLNLLLHVFFTLSQTLLLILQIPGDFSDTWTIEGELLSASPWLLSFISISLSLFYTRTRPSIPLYSIVSSLFP